MARETLDRPAFLMYAANILAKREFRGMTFEQRGLWITMILECWPNQEIPNECNHGLANYLGRDGEELTRLLPAVMWYFEERGEDLFCPTLEKYRDEQDARHKKLKEGGERGADKTNANRKDLKRKEVKADSATPTATPTATPQPPHRPSDGLLYQIKPNQTKSNPAIKERSTPEVDSFVFDMEQAELSAAARDYARASGGE